MTDSVRKLPAHVLIPEPSLAFDPQRPEDRHVHPLHGLVQYGPYSRKTVGNVLDPIRIATIAAHDENGRIDHLLNELNQLQRPQERRAYLIDYPGFSQVFGVRAVSAGSHCHLRLSADIDQQMERAERPHVALAEALTTAIGNLQSHRSEFDVVLVVLPEKWSEGFAGVGDDDDFDLHDYLKAVTASRGIPIQIMRESRALTYPCRCSVCWRLAIAVYCKAGGVPWTLADADPDTAFVGVSYAVRTVSEGPRFVTCCSQVFDADGTGLEFIAYPVKDVQDFEGDNPFLTRADMRRVMARSVTLFQRRHSGQLPNRVVIHKSSEFRHEEIDGCFDAWGRVGDLELVQIQQDVPWRAVEIVSHKKPSGYPCQRGSMLQLRGREALLWTQGNLSQTLEKNFYKEGKGIPSPLSIRRFAGHGSFHTTSGEILGLTKMNWNNDGIYDRMPVTMSFASVLAKTMKKLPKLEARPYQIRFLM